MTRKYYWVLLMLPWALVWGGAWAESSPEKDAGATEKPAGADETQLWVEPLSAETEHEASLQVRCTEEQEGGAPSVFECDYSSNAPIDAALLRIEITDSSGAVIHKDNTRVISDKEASRCQFEWDARNVPPGSYRGRFELLRRGGFVIAQRDYTIRKISMAALPERLEKARTVIEQSATVLAGMADPPAKLPYARIRTNIAQDYLERAQAALKKKDWRQTDVIARYLERTADSIRAQIVFGRSVPELWEGAATPDLAHLEIHDGAFYAKGRPVFLLGLNLDNTPTAKDIGRLHSYGLNLAVLSVGPAESLASPSEELPFAKKLQPVFQSAKKNNVSVMVSLAPDRMCPWAIEQYPDLAENPFGTTDATIQASQEILTRHIQAVAPFLAKQPMVQSICLAANPKFKFAGDKVRSGFLEEVRLTYADRHAVNQSWRGLFADLDEIEIGWNRVNPRYQESPAYCYDWESYHLRLGTEYFSGLMSQTRQLAPRLPQQIAFSEGIFEPGEVQQGVDRETVLNQVDIASCCAGNRSVDPYYAMGYPQQSLMYTFMHSMAPGKPLVNFEDKMVAETGDEIPYTFEYVYSALWDGAIAGLSASALWPGHVFDHPECLDAFATANLDLNRLADIVVAFQQAHAEVAILWSLPSKIYGGGKPYLDSARFAFEGCSFAGYKVRYLPEKECVEKKLEDVKVLVVPDTPAVTNEAFETIKTYVQKGGIVIRTALPIQFDQWGHSRRDIIPNTSRTVLLRGENLPTEYLHSLDAVMGFGDLTEIPRVINDFGYPIEGVKSRYAERDGQRYVFILNLRKDPVRCTLRNHVLAGRDLLRGRDVAFPMELMPLDPMLIRLDEPPAPTEGVAEAK